MPAPPVRRHVDVLPELVTFKDRRWLEIGCGDGGLLRWLRRQDALAIGLEPRLDLLKTAAAKLADGSGLLAARGERLPIASQSLDGIVYLNSLHHLPPTALDQALAEAARVLVAGGDLLVVEPLAEGDYFELLRPVEDETAVRTAAQGALEGAAGATAWSSISRLDYAQVLQVTSLDALLAGFLAANPARASALQAASNGLAAAYQGLGDGDDEGGRRFLQPFRLHHFKRGEATALEILPAGDDATRRACFAIRRTVFVAEQSVPLAVEFDAHDAACEMLLARLRGQPVGTLRWRRQPDGWVKIERVAVVRSARGRGVGQALMARLHAALSELDIRGTALSAQVAATGFYERLGYVPEGAPYIEEGIAHRRMMRCRPL